MTGDSSFDGARWHDIIDTYLLTSSREVTP